MTADPVNREALARSPLAKIALAAWCNVPVEKLPQEKAWIDHPDDLNRQAWERVATAIEREVLSRPQAVITDETVERAAKAMKAWFDPVATINGEFWVYETGKLSEPFRDSEEAHDLVKRINARAALIAALRPSAHGEAG